MPKSWPRGSSGCLEAVAGPDNLQLVTQCVEFFEEQLEAPLDLVWVIRRAATKLVVDDDLAFVGEPLEWSEVVIEPGPP